MSSETPFVWLITGCSSGIGRDLTHAALKRGDKVIATARARSFSAIQDLKQQGGYIRAGCDRSYQGAAPGGHRGYQAIRPCRCRREQRGLLSVWAPGGNKAGRHPPRNIVHGGEHFPVSEDLGLRVLYITRRSSQITTALRNMSTDAPFVWFITGCSSGIGRELTVAALKRGDKVIATARAQSFNAIRDLKAQGADILELDVTAHIDELRRVAAEAVKLYGHVDVVMNNAGYAQLGSLEETTNEVMVAQFNTNLFGAMNVSRAFLPYMRDRKKGTIAFIGSLLGWCTDPFGGAYVASKFALRGMAETLHLEIVPLGLSSICFDFGSFRTEVLGKAPSFTSTIQDYKEGSDAVSAGIRNLSGKQPGDTAKAVNIIIDVVKGEGVAEGRDIPTDLLLGPDCYAMVKARCESALETIEEWRKVTCSTNFDN